MTVGQIFADIGWENTGRGLDKREDCSGKYREWTDFGSVAKNLTGYLEEELSFSGVLNSGDSVGAYEYWVLDVDFPPWIPTWM